MLDLQLQFDAEITDQQSLLNGSRLISIDGETDDAETDKGATDEGETDRRETKHGPASWSLTLSFERPKGSGAQIREADLTFFAADGTLVAGLESGRADMVYDDAAGVEREVYELAFRVIGGDGRFQDWQGQIGLRAELNGTEVTIAAVLHAGAAPTYP